MLLLFFHPLSASFAMSTYCRYKWQRWWAKVGGLGVMGIPPQHASHCPLSKPCTSQLHAEGLTQTDAYALEKMAQWQFWFKNILNAFKWEFLESKLALNSDNPVEGFPNGLLLLRLSVPSFILSGHTQTVLPMPMADRVFRQKAEFRIFRIVFGAIAKAMGSHPAPVSVMK